MRKIKLLKKSTLTMWRPTYEISRMRWEINIYDDDDFPTVPHADTVDHRYKLNLLGNSGIIYRSDNKTQYGVVDKKEYARLKGKIYRLGLIKKTRDYYREHHPEKPLPLLSEERYSCNTCNKRVPPYVNRKTEVTRYIFSLKVIRK